jgi:hypothetical protein
MKGIKMKTLLKNLAALTISAVFLSGCIAGNKKPSPYFDERYISKSDISQANNVMKAAGISQIRDARSSERAPVVDTNKPSIAVFTLGTAVEALADPASIGMGAAGFMNVLFWLSQPQAPESLNYILAWVPVGDVDDPVAYQESLKKDVASLLFKSLQRDYNGQYSIKQHAYREKHRYVEEISTEGVLFHGKDCEIPDGYVMDCYTGIGLGKKSSNIDHSAKFIGYRRVPMPDFAGGKKGWLFKSNIINRFKTTFGQVRVDADLLSAWQSVSAEMPDHVYFYLAPNNYSYRDTSGVIQLGKVPLLLNKGNVMMFITYKK